ncbi:MAG: helix-turn-helix domain-containing protein [Planctomycetes bacterium]|nr:helix-turn-helix domain-containing protein [Planctomycetota bacterium]
MSTASQSPTKSGPKPEEEILTLAEAAAYLRLPEDAVLDAVQGQHLPGRKVQNEWRFLKPAIQRWLATSPMTGHQALADLAGAWKDDPYLEQMLENIYRERGRPMVD